VRLPGDGRAGRRGHDQDCAAPAFPNLITHVATTDATVTDNQMTSVIDDELAGKTLAPGRHYADSGYLSAALVVAEAARHGIALIGPLLADTSAQARAGAGYARAGFAIDYDAHAVTCPQGRTSVSWTPCTQRGTGAIVATFSADDCGPCPARSLCTTSSRKRRQLTVPPRDVAEAQAAARAEEKTTGFQADYARRAGVEGTMHQAASHGARRARYRGLPKTRPGHACMACALNLLRLHAYWTGTPLDRKRTSHLARLELGLGTLPPNKPPVIGGRRDAVWRENCAALTVVAGWGSLPRPWRGGRAWCRPEPAAPGAGWLPGWAWPSADVVDPWRA